MEGNKKVFMYIMLPLCILSILTLCVIFFPQPIQEDEIETKIIEFDDTWSQRSQLKKNISFWESEIAPRFEISEYVIYDSSDSFEILISTINDSLIYHMENTTRWMVLYIEANTYMDYRDVFKYQDQNEEWCDKRDKLLIKRRIILEEFSDLLLEE